MVVFIVPERRMKFPCGNVVPPATVHHLVRFSFVSLLLAVILRIPNLAHGTWRTSSSSHRRRQCQCHANFEFGDYMYVATTSDREEDCSYLRSVNWYVCVKSTYLCGLMWPGGLQARISVSFQWLLSYFYACLGCHNNNGFIKGELNLEPTNRIWPC